MEHAPVAHLDLLLLHLKQMRADLRNALLELAARGGHGTAA
jgi:hypothetical protein